MNSGERIEDDLNKTIEEDGNSQELRD